MVIFNPDQRCTNINNTTGVIFRHDSPHTVVSEYAFNYFKFDHKLKSVLHSEEIQTLKIFTASERYCNVVNYSNETNLFRLTVVRHIISLCILWRKISYITAVVSGLVSYLTSITLLYFRTRCSRNNDQYCNKFFHVTVIPVI